MHRAPAQEIQNFPSIGVRVNPETVVEIFIIPSLTSSELRSCLAQILSHESKPKIFLDEKIYGLFRESDGRFLSLAHILQEPEAITEEVFCLQNPTTPPLSEETDEDRAWSPYVKRAATVMTVIRHLLDFAVDQPMVSLGVSPVFVIVVYYFVKLMERVILYWTGFTTRRVLDFSSVLWDLFIFLHTMLVDTPLKEIYRYGPSFVGWEGASLYKICAESTRYGDQEFWTKNSNECKEIYLSKEHAALILFRPVVYFLIMSLIYYFKKVFHRKKEEPVDPNTVETFEALNTLVKQLRRSFESSTK